MKRFDVIVIGTGFAGSILAWVLAKSGRKVALIDTVNHPRFAIGESSTPLADKLLRRLGETYQLQPLIDLSTYGQWQASYPELPCGRKRGFAYYCHHRGERFSDPVPRSRSMLVAASASNDAADTHWYRPGMDHFLFQRATDEGATAFVPHHVTQIEPADRWGDWNQVHLDDGQVLSGRFVVDATGRSSVMHRLLGTADLTATLRTKTYCSYAHFRNVGSFVDVLTPQQTAGDPFHGDDSAQHHLVDGGWIWMLRFNHDITSVGFVSTEASAGGLLERIVASYPSLADVMRGSERVEPAIGTSDLSHIQRFVDPGQQATCWMLPTAIATVDPLHSTGIAHALAGVTRIAEAILGVRDDGFAQRYRGDVLAEVRFLDRVISTAYRTMPDFQAFSFACMIYFAGAIGSEERLDAGETIRRLWSADSGAFVRTALLCCHRLESPGGRESGMDWIRDKMRPFNTAGLFQRDCEARYAYTATK
ncbi:NAD(P)/FAD-dependent oxidoreductase [Stieleria varia]|uniref:Tryptophan halogenase n=1 Tax=Stieleria varia TaxID=2528005 RepID=A0A5C5ZMT0_9BACT|nr:FAD-dependent oxidoreductase [Stieleria varia]TWT87753.1 hypothetical protein Pla52n_70120 [Stieleria varia]